MSRIRNLVSGVSSSYLALASNIVYTMGSIPVALHYLSKEEFGLWALISQLAGYLALIDLGMGSSAARILIDYKDDRDGGRYGSAVVTSGLVFITQGTLIGGFGCLLSPFVALLAQVSPQFSHLFGNLFAFQSILLGLGFVVRAVSTPAVAHQRYYVGNLALMVQLLVSFAVLWIGFSMHLKLYSMVLAGLLGFLCSATIHTIAVIKMGFLPSRGCWGKPDRRIFRELFLYGKDVFLLSLGWQLLNASQVVVITRVMGLDAAATWSVCTKIFTLAQQLVWRIYDMSVGAFTEMLVRGENDRLSKRFRETLVLTASLSIFVAATVALCNASFLSLWTHGRISWSPLNDMLLGVLMVVYSVNRCHGGLFGVT
ncbi:MAG: oligosaccharide flippase family protein, partial [Verrucomicrobia bacterium]|nr:oligosaccharide flippase family protein [Verrucomicrobiota bacterium]